MKERHFNYIDQYFNLINKNNESFYDKGMSFLINTFDEELKKVGINIANENYLKLLVKDKCNVFNKGNFVGIMFEYNNISYHPLTTIYINSSLKPSEINNIYYLFTEHLDGYLYPFDEEKLNKFTKMYHNKKLHRAFKFLYELDNTSTNDSEMLTMYNHCKNTRKLNKLEYEIEYGDVNINDVYFKIDEKELQLQIIKNDKYNTPLREELFNTLLDEDTKKEVLKNLSNKANEFIKSRALGKGRSR